MKEYYKITEVARLYGLCTDTLRYYEEQGLLHPHRSETGYRLYSIDDICNLNVIRALRELDMPVPQWMRAGRVWSGMTGRNRACCACWSCRNVPVCNCRRTLSWSARSTSH